LRFLETIRMENRPFALRDLFLGRRPARTASVRRPRRVVLSCDTLEGRVTPSHGGGGLGTLAAGAQFGPHHGGSGSPTPTNTALTTALQTLHKDVQTIELASSTTVGELTAIKAAFQTLKTDGLTPTSRSALQSFEDSLVTTLAKGTTLTGNTTLLGQFGALY